MSEQEQFADVPDEDEQQQEQADDPADPDADQYEGVDEGDAGQPDVEVTDNDE